MKNLIIITLFMCAAPSLQADWREEVNAIQREISALTANEQGLDDVTRLRRFYDLSYDLSMLENPVFATGLGDPRLPPGSLGYVNLLGLAAIAPTTVLMAPLGARIAHGFSARNLSVSFGLFLVIVSLRLFYRALLPA